jgi:heme-degrading monooxygenase HmoA
VWEDESAVAAALPQLHRGADEAWHAILVAIGGHGTWGGFDVLVASGGDTAPSEPVAVVTRAGVRVGAWRPFRRGSVAVDATLAGADGLLAVVGFGEAPVGRLGTFSVWRDLDAMGRWSRNPAHGDVVRRTRSERWYGEELFARFAIAGSAGTWDGRDPLASSGTSIP